MERRTAERKEAKGKKSTSLKVMAEFLGKLMSLTPDQKKRINDAEAYFGPWRELREDENIPASLREHIDQSNGVPMVPTRIFGQ